MSIPRSEHPFPQMMRGNWMNLNGEWEFEIDNSLSGKDKKFFLRDSLDSKITVPFCPESELSGIGNKDFMYCVWYRKEFTLPENFLGHRIILHFGAVDYISTVYINGIEVRTHKGGYTSFSTDITNYLKDGKNVICLCVEDNKNKYNQPSGKQSEKFESHGCFYTRSTGIWQTVWIEAVGSAYIANFHTFSDMENGVAMFKISLGGKGFIGKTLKAKASFESRSMGYSSTKIYGDNVYVSVPLDEIHLWDIGKGNLYDIVFSIWDGDKAIDSVLCYFGMRTFSFGVNGFEINGRTIFGRWVLDQGYYPDGIYTAPTDEALKDDILKSIELGFNGARLHEKVFEPRFLYWADKLGYPVWGEFPNWGFDISEFESIDSILPQWAEVIDRDFSHPSIIGWCPLNETDYPGYQKIQNPKVVKYLYEYTKKADPTRPVIDTSGFFHEVDCEVYDVHDYEQDYKLIEEYYSKLDRGIIQDITVRLPKWSGRQSYKGQPVFVSEYGGILWDMDNLPQGEESSWGYGDAPKSEDEFLDRFKNLTETFMNNPKICAICYTQLYDVEQERNGLMTYDRKHKFNPEVIRRINSQKAKIEK